MLGWMRGTIQRVMGVGKGRYYVYRLHYPDDAHVFGHLAGKTFYVGKGTRDRILAHERETRAILKSGRGMLLKHKHKVILSIWDAGYDVVQEVIHRTDDEEEAFLVESEEIDRIGLARLTNATYGRRPRYGRRRAA